MVDCPVVVHEKIKARIEAANMVFVTPGMEGDQSAHGYIMSFNINRARGNPVGTLSVQLEVWIRTPFSNLMQVQNDLGPMITVRAGAPTNYQSFDDLPMLFTGYIKSMQGDPHFNDARKYILSINAEDTFTKMRNKKYSRRFKMEKAAFALIRGGERKQTGRMKQLERVNKKHPPQRIKVKSYIDHQHGHSPLYKTPEGRNPRTPSGRTVREDDTSSIENQYVYAFSPSTVYLQPGQCAIVSLLDENGEERLITTENDYDSDKGGVEIDSYASCCTFVNPNVSKAGSQATNAMTDRDNRPISLQVINSAEHPDLFDENTYGKFLVCMNDWSPATATYVDPVTRALARIEVIPVPIHDHSSMAQGGPIAATYIGV